MSQEMHDDLYAKVKKAVNEKMFEDLLQAMVEGRPAWFRA